MMMECCPRPPRLRCKGVPSAWACHRDSVGAGIMAGAAQEDPIHYLGAFKLLHSLLY